LFETHIFPASPGLTQSHEGSAAACQHPHTGLPTRWAASRAELCPVLFLDLMNEPYKNSPRSCRFRALNPHDGREVIPLCEIHQMNCFDDAVCLPGMHV
jgi:hypothetical protein